MPNVEFSTQTATTRFLGVALRWFDAGYKTAVMVNGECVGMMTDGKEVEDMDDDVFYDNEPYGTIHYVKSTGIRCVRLPSGAACATAKNPHKIRTQMKRGASE